MSRKKQFITMLEEAGVHLTGGETTGQLQDKVWTLIENGKELEQKAELASKPAKKDLPKRVVKAKSKVSKKRTVKRTKKSTR